jgi:hypothetical protein
MVLPTSLLSHCGPLVLSSAGQGSLTSIVVGALGVLGLTLIFGSYLRGKNELDLGPRYLLRL